MIIINDKKIDFHHIFFLTSFYGAILHNAHKKIKSALPIGMLLKDIRMFSNIQRRATFLLN